MKQIIEKLTQAEKEMAVEKGPFLLFGMFLREDAPDVWDLVVASPWIDSDRPNSLRYISDKINAILEPRELVKLSRIVLVELGSPAIVALQQTFHAEHAMIEVKDSDFFGLRIKHAYVITSQRNTDARSLNPASHPG